MSAYGWGNQHPWNDHYNNDHGHNPPPAGGVGAKKPVGPKKPVSPYAAKPGTPQHTPPQGMKPSAKMHMARPMLKK